MIINFHIKVVYLIKTYPEASVIPFSQEHTCRGQGFRLSHAVHKIEFPYIHIAILYVLIPVYQILIQITYRYLH